MSKTPARRRWPWVLGGIAVLVAVLSLFVRVEIGPGPVRDPRPVGGPNDILALPQRADTNILFVLIDMLRADRLGAYGYERNTSPEIDKLAASGIRFSRHLSQSSWTKASMASIWTGMNPTRTGITRFNDVIPEEALLPAEILSEAGFLTQGIWRNGWVSDKFGFGQGFAAYTRPATLRRQPQEAPPNPIIEQRGTDDDLVQAAIEFLRIHRDDRWFLYLHMMDVHEYTFDEESASFGGSYSDVYDNAIQRTDYLVGVLWSYLVDMGIADETILVIGSDHGEAFRERGFEGHARFVYRETTEVPLIVALPFRLEPGVVIEERTRNIDVWPTVLELVGAPALPNTDGRSLVPDVVAAARGEALPAADRTGVAHLDQTWGTEGGTPKPTIAISDGPLRYVRREGATGSVEQLFDASRDPMEFTDRAEEEQETLERLQGVADEELDRVPPWTEVPRRELGELELNQLRALGYALP